MRQNNRGLLNPLLPLRTTAERANRPGPITSIARRPKRPLNAALRIGNHEFAARPEVELLREVADRSTVLIANRRGVILTAERCDIELDGKMRLPGRQSFDLILNVEFGTLGGERNGLRDGDL